MSCVRDIMANSKVKHFSNAVITWEIERFSLITSTQPLIHSSLITLVEPVETRWQMYLDISEKRNRISLKVEMLPHSTQIKTVKVLWAFCLLDENEKGSFSTERHHTFEPKSSFVMECFPFKETMDMLKKKPFDNLIIKCRMLVTFGLIIKLPEARVDGVVRMSKDLTYLHRFPLYNDITTTVNDVVFYLHKAMLFQRGEKLLRMMEQSTSNMNVNFALSDANAAHSIFTYLYSGDLNFIVSRPRITISDYIDHLDIPGLKDVYCKHKIRMISSVELREHECSIEMKNVTKSEVYRELEIPGMNSLFRLHLSIKELKDNESKRMLLVEAELVNSENILVLCLELDCSNDENKILPLRIHGVMTEGDKLNFRLLDVRPDMKEFFMSENLKLKLKFYIRMRDICTSIVENKKPRKAELTNEKSVMILSRLMSQIKTSAAYSDFHFEVNGKLVKAHKFLVAARSSVMKELFRRHNGLASVKVYDCETDVFEKFLSYVYGGILYENDGTKLIKMYNLGNQYNISGLPEAVMSILSKFINEENMLDILIFADDILHTQLKKSALDYVLAHGNNLDQHKDYYKFVTKKPRIQQEIRDIQRLQQSTSV